MSRLIRNITNTFTGNVQGVIQQGGFQNYCSISGANGVIMQNDGSGTTVTMNGRVYKLPRGRNNNIRVDGNAIFIDGKRWKPDEDRDATPMTTRTYEFTEDVNPDSLEFIGVADKVVVKPGDKYTCKLEVKATSRVLDQVICTPKRIEIPDGDMETCTLVLTIPENAETTEVSIKGAVDVNLTGLTLPRMDVLLVASTVVRVEDCVFNDVDCRSTSGKITLTNVTVGESMDVEAVSGDLSVSRSKAKTLRSTTVSGDMCVSGSYPRVICKAVSGDIQCSNIQADQVTLETVSGDASLTAVQADTILVETISGDLGGRGPVKPRFSTVSGDNDFRVTI